MAYSELGVQVALMSTEHFSQSLTLRYSPLQFDEKGKPT